MTSRDHREACICRDDFVSVSRRPGKHIVFADVQFTERHMNRVRYELTSTPEQFPIHETRSHRKPLKAFEIPKAAFRIVENHRMVSGDGFVMFFEERDLVLKSIRCAVVVTIDMTN